MPVLVEPDNPTVASLLKALPAGSHGVNSPDRMRAWLDSHPDEYVAVLGPDLLFDAAIDVCEELRIARPTVSVILVRDTLDTDVLTRAMKAGARDVVAGDDDSSISAAIQRAHQLHVALRGPAGAIRRGKVITVFSPKGGVGKTTVAVNLALGLTEKGARKVCLVDLDLAFGDVAITMQLFPTHSIEQAVGSEDSIDQTMLDGLLTRHKDSLMVLAAPAHPDVRERVTPVLISRILKTLKEEFDYVVVDTAPTFDDITLTALDETDECLILATLDVPTLKNVKVALETLDLLNISPGHRHLLLNRADDAVGITVDKVETILGMPVVVRIGTDVAIAAATNAGTPIIADRPGHASSIAIAGLAASFAGEPVTAPDDEESAESRKRRFGRKSR
jgi:pilus assembly protein CpaE